MFKAELISSLPLREGVSTDTVFNFTMLVLTQISNKYMQIYKNSVDQPTHLAHYESAAKEIDEYIDLIKYGVYK
jgi:hypothetical protein